MEAAIQNRTQTPAGNHKPRFAADDLAEFGVSMDGDGAGGVVSTDRGKRSDVRERFPLVSSAALDGGDYTASPIITEVLFAGSPAVIGGMYKVGKTLLAIAVAISIATGRLFLRTYTVPDPRVVVYFTGEGGPAVAQEYGRRIAASMGVKLADATNLHWCFSVPKLEDLRDLNAFDKVLEETGAEVAILDNLMLCLSGENAGNVYSMGGVLGNAVRICSERGVTPIFVHHFKRTRTTADPFAPGELADLTQAGVAEIAGQWLLLARRQPFDPDQAGEHRLWLTIGGRLGHSSLHALDIHEGHPTDVGGRRWDVDLMRSNEVKRTTQDQKEAARATERQERRDLDKRTICNTLVKFPQGESKSIIKEASGLNTTRFNPAFGELFEAGSIVACEIVKANRKKPYQGFKLAECAPHE